MNTTLLFMRITLIVKQVFDKRTGTELQAVKEHFSAAYSDAQLCALVIVGMILRVFGLAKPAEGSRSTWFVVGMLIKFLKALGDQPDGFRAGPNPLDALVEEGMREIGEHG